MPTLKDFSRTVGLTAYRMNMLALRSDVCGGIIPPQNRAARLRSVCRINCNQFNAGSKAFVVQEHSQLEECPTVATPALGFVSRLSIGAFSDACKVFNSNGGIVLKCRQNNQFTDVMVQPLLVSFLTPRQPLQNLFRPATRSTIVPFELLF